MDECVEHGQGFYDEKRTGASFHPGPFVTLIKSYFCHLSFKQQQKTKFPKIPKTQTCFALSLARTIWVSAEPVSSAHFACITLPVFNRSGSTTTRSTPETMNNRPII